MRMSVGENFASEKALERFYFHVSKLHPEMLPPAEWSSAEASIP